MGRLSIRIAWSLLGLEAALWSFWAGWCIDMCFLFALAVTAAATISYWFYRARYDALATMYKAAMENEAYLFEERDAWRLQALNTAVEARRDQCGRVLP